ncbi:SMI1/KNR4 family protein [Rhizobium sp. R693]|uniref:SMI1/KNR4 family protein n=1 Tax=Rhizobium sp. R693 TaxID=1764276 RepID=UPI000B52AD29|nr:SMI1/KNR4 family protein [Rhizobium sp. R693]
MIRITRRIFGALAAGLSMPRRSVAAPESSNPLAIQPEKLVADMKRIDTWLAAHAPPRFLPIYREPASLEQITQAEREIGVQFHPDLHALLSFTNGATSSSPSLAGAFGLMTLDEMVSAYKFLLEEFPGGKNLENPNHAPIDADVGVRPVWWWPKWIPFMENGGGDYLCVDMDPTAGGNLGQIVIYYHDEAFRRRDAQSIGEMFARIADGLETGTYTFNLNHRMIAKR